MAVQSPRGGSANIMIVDDTPHHLRLLTKMLTDGGYTVRPFPRGRLALEAARRDPPELLLLDINMPEMNGFEVCRQLKQDPLLSDIPVIFLSASGATSDKVEAFNSGGVDYVTKPYHLEEVTARVETHLELSRLQRQLEEHNRRLEELVRERTWQLSEARDRLTLLDKAKSDFLQFISHQLRTPLNGVLGVAGILVSKSAAANVPGAERLGTAFQTAQRELLTTVDDALLLTEISVAEAPAAGGRTLLTAIIAEAAALMEELARSRQVELGEPPPSSATIHGDRFLLVRAFAALLETAIKLSGRGETVTWRISRGGHGTTITVEARGHAIPGDDLPHFFQAFAIAQALTPGGDLGLRPVVADRIIALFGGSLSAANRDPAGVAFTIRLPGPGRAMLSLFASGQQQLGSAK